MPEGSSSRPMCPRARSEWTPCYLRDGDTCIVEAFRGVKVCVGCEKPIEKIKAWTRRAGTARNGGRK